MGLPLKIHFKKQPPCTHVSPGPAADDLVVAGRLQPLHGQEIEHRLQAATEERSINGNQGIRGLIIIVIKIIKGFNQTMQLRLR